MTSESQAPKLKLALLVDDLHLQAVFAEAIDHIRASSFAEIVLVVRNGAPASGKSGSASLASRAAKFVRSPKLRHAIVYALYVKFDAWRTYKADLDPTRLVDCSQRLAGVEEIRVVPEQNGAVHRFPQAAIDAIRARDIDVIVRFGFNILKGDILTAARYGIWSFHHGDNDFYRGLPPYMWELLEDNPRCGAILQILGDDLDNGLVLAKGQYASEGGLSLFRNRIAPYWGSVHFLIWKLKELHERGFAFLQARAVPPAPYRGLRRLYGKPRNREMLGWLWRMLKRKVPDRFPRRALHWMTAIRRRTAEPALRPAARTADLSGFRFIMAPNGHFYADPFLFAHEGRTFLFLEDFSYAESRGDIAVMDVTDEVPDTARICLSTGSHLSYPFVFSHDGAIYMIPESLAAGEVALYRAEVFPDRWVKTHVLFRGAVVDTTPWFENGVWYFFVTFIVPGTEAVALHLFIADGLTEPWRPHPASPLSHDVRDARGAGRLFRQNGGLFRPAQDCSGTYGRAIRVFQVDALTPDTYAEHFVLEVGPDAVPDFADRPAEGIHTYDDAGGFEVIDAKFKLPVGSF
ncbi:hypothetical protein [Aquabacter spiritensis]|uniref:glucosamine inositolphosphorylceramide transferase family protein n=1 Tax=Aquabacter spiritensis TaxID=933073 RepID=UPI00104A82E6|nr:hypothetical protein [Aquabacter spiritensis]